MSGLRIEIEAPMPTPANPAEVLEAIVARDPRGDATLERAGHVEGRTTEGVPLTVSSIKFRDAENTVIEGRLVAYYAFADVAAIVSCRMVDREALVRFGPAMTELFASARLDRADAPPRINDLYD